jgi:hypothetical protein
MVNLFYQTDRCSADFSKWYSASRVSRHLDHPTNRNCSVTLFAYEVHHFFHVWGGPKKPWFPNGPALRVVIDTKPRLRKSCQCFFISFLRLENVLGKTHISRLELVKMRCWLFVFSVQQNTNQVWCLFPLRVRTYTGWKLKGIIPGCLSWVQTLPCCEQIVFMLAVLTFSRVSANDKACCSDWWPIKLHLTQTKKWYSEVPMKCPIPPIFSTPQKPWFNSRLTHV